jgi:hypothetical protein
MTFAYKEYEVDPTPSQPESIIYRPVIPIHVTGPHGTEIIEGLVDTGSDVTILPAFVLGLIGAKYQGGEQGRFRGVGAQTVTVHYSRVELGLQYGKTAYRWPVKAGFLDGRTVAILGYAGFLEYFHATFDAERHRLSLNVNKRFPGKAVAASPRL